MREFFGAWVMSMSAIIIFGSMCEMILPDSSYKKYVHLAIGLMLIMAVLKPLVGRDVDIKAEIPAGDYKSAERTEVKNRSDITRVYEEKLKESLSREKGLEGAEIELEICGEEEDFGDIEKVCIRTREKIGEANINAVMKKYGLAENEIKIEYVGRGDSYET